MNIKERIFTQKQIKNGFIRIFFMGFVFNLCVAVYFWGAVESGKHTGNSLLLFVPLILMTFYWWKYRGYVGKNESSRDQFADSLYYLGFLFTLMHLSFALVPWVFNPKMDSFYLLAQFGMAITTTLTGLFLRLYETQFRDEDTGGMRTTQQALGESTAAFIAQLEVSTTRLKEYHEKTIPYLEEQANTFVKSMQQVSVNAIAEIDKTSTSFGAATSEAIQKLTTKLDEVTHNVADAAKQQLAITKKLSDDMATDFRINCTSILSSFKSLTEQALGETRSILDRLKWTVGRIDVQLTGKMQALADELDQSIASIKSHRERSLEILTEINRVSLEEMQSSAKILKEGIHVVVKEAVAATEKVAHTSIAKIGETAEEISRRWHDDLSGLIAETKMLLAGLNQSIGMMRESSQEMDSATRKIVNQLNDVVTKAINDAAEGMSNLNEQTQTTQTRFEELKNLIESFGPLSLVVRETTKALESNNIAFQQINQEASATHTKLQEELHRISILREQLGKELATSTKLTQQVYENLVQGLQFVVKELGRPPQ